MNGGGLMLDTEEGALTVGTELLKVSFDTKHTGFI